MGSRLKDLVEDSKFLQQPIRHDGQSWEEPILPTLQGMILDLGGSNYDDIPNLSRNPKSIFIYFALGCFVMVLLFSSRSQKI